TVIDHHKSAEKELEGFMSLPGVSGIFDMTKSGAMLTYEYFWNGDRNDKELASIFWMKRAIEYIQDRDLWKFELEGSKEYSMAVFSYEYDFEIWDKEVFSKTPCQLISEGAHLLRKMEKDKKELIAAIAYRGDIGGHNVPMINVPYIYASEIAGLL
ncbi:MAG: hypothetical protein GWN62_09935, partial [Aliifodinibius sp.]|nr:hypothetical protein [Fodinibius sp.]NIW80951.1 hypothetical protein [Calditrichia bacterium]